ncbi:MAG: 2-succinyl-6-hydroxy-2,4-cyclohexadiene-carboxylate synthase [Solirubrobacteraceae bacterium]|nr:2-succinyl-6-hydroxy-2,4-cyclohexadiene-carboxylate synthase [Solirubrobacteraceae bacterium]
MLIVGGQDVRMSGTLLLLHGFTQTGGSWSPVLAALGEGTYRPVAPDIRGHGEAGDRRPIGFEEVVADVLEAAGDGPFTLAGYSQGGRIALHLALAVPERVRRLVLISTTAGIDGEEDRARRRAADEIIAGRMEGQGMEVAARAWAAQALFGGQTDQVFELAHEDRMRNDPANLAAALRGIGTGRMTPLWERLPELTMPAAVLVGARDLKFVDLGRRLADTLPDASFTVVPEAGHALPLEAPEAVAAALRGS